MSQDGEDDRAPADALRIALSHRLTLVVAAPGWGKTTLLRRLARAAPSIVVTRPATGWTPFALTHQLLDGLAALAPLDSGVLPGRPAPDSPDNPDQPAALAASFCAAAAAAIDAETVVVIDDADVPADDPLLQFIEALVLHLPPRLHLVLACRRAPPLRIARLRAAGEVARISTSDLAVLESDVGALGLDPAATETITEIVRSTGGWPLAVQLAAEALRRSGPIDRATLVDRLLAPDAVLFDYLAEEVLAGFAEPERELLAIAGHLPYVSADLLGDLGRADLAPLLAPIGAAGNFLEAAPGDATDTYRASLLGRAFLRRALPAPPTAARRAAVDVLVRRGELEPALALCAELGDPALARDVVLAVERPERLSSPDALARALLVAEAAGQHPRIVELQGDLQYFGGDWDAALASYATATSLGDPAEPRLARKQGVILYLRGRLDEAEAVCAAARLDGSNLAEESQVLAWWAAIRWIRGDVEGCRRLLDPAEQAATASGDDAALATVYTTQAMLAAMRGDRRGNANSYRRALAHAERAGDVVQIVRIRTNRGSHHTEEGDYQDALVELGAAIEIAELVGLETFSALAYSNRGDTHMRMGRLDDALRDLRRAQAIWERLGSEVVDYALGQLGDVQALRGQRSEALALYRQAIEISERRGDVQGLVPALIGVARILAADDVAAAAAAAERAIEASQAVWQPHAIVAAGWVSLRRGDLVGAAARADEALGLAHAHQDRPAAAEALLLRASVQQPPAVATAEEAGQLWHDLGNPIGEARALMLVSESRTGSARDALLADAERLLFDAGAWGYLADARRASSAAAANAAPIAISSLGGFRVSRDGTPVEVGEWGSRKARDLVKLLVARRGAPVVREEVVAMLWPDEPDRSARRLSVLLSTIRGVLDPAKTFAPDHYVAADHDTVWLVREHVDVDVEVFLREAAEGRRLLANGADEKAAIVLTQATGRYLGDFFAEDPYADWAAGLRELARHTFVEAAGHLGRLADERGEHGEAVRHRLRILDVDPYDEAAHLGLIRALGAQRRHGEARRAYRTYCTRLQELDVDPAPFPA